MLKLEFDTVRAVCSGQVITSPYSIVKELTENSLDAHATIVDIRVENFGLSKIELRDNGDGIESQERHMVALPHYTSKLKEFSQISFVGTYGYRGEALSAICSVAKVTMITKHSSDSVALSYTIDKHGTLTEIGSCHNNNGTTFVITDLFKTLPVRRTFYQGKRGKEQLDLMETFIKGMAIANPRVRFMLRHNKALVWQHSISSTFRASLASVYGSVGDMVHFSRGTSETSPGAIEGMLTATGKSARKPPHFIINRRLVKFKALSKALRSMFGGSYPHGAICITLEPSCVDVNIEVDKSAVVCKDEAELVSLVEQLVREEVLNMPEKEEQPDATLDFYENNIASQSMVLDTSSPQLNTSSPQLAPKHPHCNSPDRQCRSVADKHAMSSIDAEPDGHGLVLPRKAKEKPNVKLMRNLMCDSSDEDLAPIGASGNRNLSMWEDLEKDLNSDEELFSPVEASDNLNLESNGEKLINMIDDSDEHCALPKQGKQSSIMSWSQGNSDFKLEFISPEQITPVRKTKSTTPSLSHTVTKKRNKSASPCISEKRRRISSFSPIMPKSSNTNSNAHSKKGNILNFDIQYIKAVGSFHHSSNPSIPNAFNIDNKWVIIWQNNIFFFNPSRAQELNIYKKLMCSQSLKYGHALKTCYTWKLTLADTGHKALSYLVSCRTTTDSMDQTEFVIDKSLAINGIRIKKENDGLFVVTNVCDDISDFSKEDVLETLDLIVQREQRDCSEAPAAEVFLCDYSDARSEKTSCYFKEKAARMCLAFMAFKPTATDVMDLFSNTSSTDVCVHGNTFTEVLWDLDQSLSDD